MANQKKMVDDITSMDVDFSKWYTDIVKKAELMDYSSVKGCMIIQPYGYAIWENIQRELDDRFKATGHQNVYMPLFIPESLLQKEKDHVKGFAPEVAWVTEGGSEKLTERLCVRPTSEILFCEHYQKIIKSYRDLPKLYNQWCSVVRWEKTTRPFLRSSEFLWQEGHTMHETAEEAMAETLGMLSTYEEFYKNVLAIPAVTGQKTEKEKFAGAVATYTIEPMMDNGVLSSTIVYGGGRGAGGGEPLFRRRLGKEFRHHVHGPRQHAAAPVPDLLGRFHPHDRRDHHGARRRQRPRAAAEGRPHPARDHPDRAAQARRARQGERALRCAQGQIPR